MYIGAQVQAGPPLASYPSTPPASGHHDPTPLDAGIYRNPPPIYRAIHSLEHGAIIVWLPRTMFAGEGAPAASAIASFFALLGNDDHVIVVVHGYPLKARPVSSLPGEAWC